MTDLDKIDFIDDLLMRLEDFTHGEEGRDITKSRKYLIEIRKGQELSIHNVSNSCDNCKNKIGCRFLIEAKQNGNICKFHIPHDY